MRSFSAALKAAADPVLPSWQYLKAYPAVLEDVRVDDTLKIEKEKKDNHCKVNRCEVERCRTMACNLQGQVMSARATSLQSRTW